MKEYKITTEISIKVNVPDDFEITDTIKYHTMYGLKKCIENGMSSEFHDVNIGELQIAQLTQQEEA